MAEVEEDQPRKSKRTKKASGVGGKERWPTIKPKKDIQINRLKSTHLFTIPNLLSSGEAKAFIETAESLGFVHQGSQGPTKGEAFRDNHRISVNDPQLARSIWESGLSAIFQDIKIRGKIAAGLNPNIRFYRYTVGQRFGRHIDESVYLENGLRTYYTLLIYLSGRGGNKDASSDSLVGGETVFYDQGRVVAEVAPVEGMALLHIHGDKCMLHEARVVSKNFKYVLRSDVAFA
ncbi:2-oxoglutarate (2OG) and Fe(II)-dependent oxygenase superfamily protein [Carex rostrata]